MKITVCVSRDNKLIDHCYEFGDFPEFRFFLDMSDPLIRRVRMVGFEDKYLIPARIALDRATRSFKEPGHFVLLKIDEDDLLHPGPPVYLKITLEKA